MSLESCSKCELQRVFPRIHFASFAGLLLAAAALLKFVQILFYPSIEVFAQLPKQVAIIQTEFFVGAWILSAWRGRTSRLVGIFLFTLFAMISYSKIGSNSASCGCFGVIEVPPQYTFLLDIAALITLLAWQPKDGNANSKFLLIVLGLSMFANSLLLGLWPQPKSIDQITQRTDWVVLEPESWIGSSFPLYDFLSENADELKTGNWQVIVYREDCDECQELIAGYLLSQSPIAFIKMPPHLETRNRKNTTNSRWYNLDNSRRWFVKTPVVIYLKDGIVTKID